MRNIALISSQSSSIFDTRLSIVASVTSDMVEELPVIKARPVLIILGDVEGAVPKVETEVLSNCGVNLSEIAGD